MVTYTNEQLLKIKKSLEDAQHIAKIGSWDWNIITSELWWSPEIYRIFGLEVDQFEATYEAFLRTLHPDDVELVVSSVQNAVDDTCEYNLVHRIVLPNSEVRFVHEVAYVTRNSKNEAIHMVGTVHDITESKQIDEKLRLSAEVIRNSLEGIIITDENRKIIEINPAFTNITGYTTDDICDKEPSMLKSGWHDDAFYKAMWSEINENGKYKGEIWDRKKDGTLYAASISISSIKDKNSKITNYISITSDITEKQENERKIHNLAYFDMLTSLPNRTLFQDRATQRIASAKNHKDDKIAFLFLDLDNFKYINDSLGHQTGDLFLQVASNRIKQVLSEDSELARLGGDEFVVMIGYAPHEKSKVTECARLIIDECNRSFAINEHLVYSGVSIGISVFPDDATSYEALLKQADIAMYKAKELGKNRFEFFIPQMNKDAHERLYIENGLRSAIANRELFLEYQPKICLKSRGVSGMEALVRWQHDGSVIPPFRFIPIIENSPMIIEVGEWVLRTACLATKEWHKMGYEQLVVSVNVTNYQLKQDGYIQSVKNLLAEMEFDPKHLELEITESTIMEDVEKMLVKLNELKNMGISISIDDFGTGYSSISYLKKLPAKILKIDRSFVMDSHKDASDKSIMSAIIALAKSLELETIAEGAELKEHIEILEELGCEKVQGYYFSKPLTVEKFTQFLREF